MNIKIGLRFTLIIYFILSIALSALTEEEKIALKAEFEKYVLEKNQTKVVAILLEHNEFYKANKNRLEQWALTTVSDRLLARFVFHKFLKNIPHSRGRLYLIGDTRNKVIRFIQNEMNYFKENYNASPEDLIEIKKCFAIVTSSTIREVYYDVLPFLAYPLAEIRRKAIQYLATLKQDKTIPIIAKMASSVKPIDRTYAIDALFYLHDERTTPILINALKDKNKSVRLYAIRSLERLRAAEAVPYYIKIISSDLDHEVKIRAIQILSNKKIHRARRAIQKAISDRHRLVRKEAINASLYYSRTSSTKYFSEQLFIETDNELKILLLKAMLQKKSAAKAKGINKILTAEQNEDVRLWAIYIAGRLKAKRTVKSLLFNLQSGMLKFQIEASNALARFKSSEISLALYRQIANSKAAIELRATALYSYIHIEKNYRMKLQLLKPSLKSKYFKLQVVNVLQGRY